MNLLETWSGMEWRVQAQQWITQVLAGYNILQTGLIEQPRLRFWSTQLTVPTDHGLMWFKENNPGQFAEASIVACIAELAPGRVLDPLAIEPSRGWMLTPDHGATLASLKLKDASLWARVVTDFAGLQRALVPHGDRLAAAGLISMDPSIAGNFVSNQLLLHAGLPPGHPLHLPPEAADKVHAGIPRIDEAAATLKALGVPLSLEHNDLHANNAFIPGTSTEPLRFFDFGDAYWAHPFTSLYVPVGMMMEEWRTGPDDERIRSVLRAYLECWTDVAPLPELLAALEPALKLGRLNRYGSWLRLLIHADDASMAELGPHTLDYLLTLADPVLDPVN